MATHVRRNEELLRHAKATVARICDELGAALDDRHAPLIEDYLVIDIERFEPRLEAELLLHDHSESLANILLGESGSLSQSEIEESLRTRFSYYNDDLTIVQWDTAFIYDRRESSDAIQDILEFANSQLLELRTYDTLLDNELDSIYAAQPGQRSRSLFGRREADLAANVRYLIVDVLELIDRSSNALKVVGDAYYARIYRAAAARLGLADWQRQIDSKLASVRRSLPFLHRSGARPARRVPGSHRHSSDRHRSGDRRHHARAALASRSISSMCARFFASSINDASNEFFARVITSRSPRPNAVATPSKFSAT